MARRTFVRGGRGYVPPESGKTHAGGSGSTPRTVQRIVEAAGGSEELARKISTAEYGSEEYPVGSTPETITRTQMEERVPTVEEERRVTARTEAVRGMSPQALQAFLRKATTEEREALIRDTRLRYEVPKPIPVKEAPPKVIPVRREEERGMITLPEEKGRLQRIKEFAKVYGGFFVKEPKKAVQLILPTREAKGRFVTEAAMFAAAYPIYKATEFFISPAVAKLSEKEIVAKREAGIPLTITEKAKLEALKILPLAVGFGAGLSKVAARRLAALKAPIKAETLAIIKPRIKIEIPKKRIKITEEPIKGIKITRPVAKPPKEITISQVYAETKLKIPLKKPVRVEAMGMIKAVKVKRKPIEYFRTDMVARLKGKEEIIRAKGLIREFRKPIKIEREIISGIKVTKKIYPKGVFISAFEEVAKKPRFKGLELGKKVTKIKGIEFYKTVGKVWGAKKPFRRIIMKKPKPKIITKGVQAILPMFREPKVSKAIFGAGIRRTPLEKTFAIKPYEPYPIPARPLKLKPFLKAKKVKVKKAKAISAVPVRAIFEPRAEALYRTEMIGEVAAEPLAIRIPLPKIGEEVFVPVKMKPSPISLKFAPPKVAQIQLPKQISLIKPLQIAKIGTRVGTRPTVAEAFMLKPAQLFKPVVSFIQPLKQALKQRAMMRQALIKPVPTPITYPVRPFMFPLKVPKEVTVSTLKKLAKKIRRVKGYQLFIKRAGVFKPVGEPLARGLAISVGAKRVRETLAATFMIKPTKEFVPAVDADFEPSPEIFRKYKIRKGVRIPVEDIWIQRAEKRLSTMGEVGEIQAAKKRRGGFSWF